MEIIAAMMAQMTKLVFCKLFFFSIVLICFLLSGFPKTPGVPLANNQSDDESDVESKKNENSDSNDSDSVQSEENNVQEKSDSDDNQSDSNGEDDTAHRESDHNKSSDSDSESDDEEQKRESESVTKRDENSKDSDFSNENDNQQDSNSSNSESDANQVSRKRKNMVQSDESDQEKSDKEINPNEADLFGELSDEDDDANRVNDSGDERIVTKKARIEDDEDDNADDQMNVDEGNDERHNQELYEMIDEEEEPVPETRIEVEIPRIVANLGDKIHFVKLPNFLSIDTHPYDPQWYEDEIDEDEVHDDEGRARLKLKVENTLRWRNVTDEDGNVTKESNARVVKWSDGSMSLLLGDEIFDIQTLNLLPGENNHLFIRQGTGLQVNKLSYFLFTSNSYQFLFCFLLGSISISH